MGDETLAIGEIGEEEKEKKRGNGNVGFRGSWDLWFWNFSPGIAGIVDLVV